MLCYAILFFVYGVGVGSNFRISHLQLANDNLILGEKSWRNIRALKASLILCEIISGLKVNFH